jgi:DNA-directed RNA polymerase specialized sigma24 family protein
MKQKKLKKGVSLKQKKSRTIIVIKKEKIVKLPENNVIIKGSITPVVELTDKQLDRIERQKARKMYMEPKAFREKILQYYKDEVFTDDLSKGIYDIANRLAFSPNFINYSYREEMVGDAIIKMIQALKNKKFNKNIVNKNGEKGNPYSYYTRIAFNAFCNRIKKEKKAHEALLRYQDMVHEKLIDSGTINNKHQHDIDEEGNNSHNDNNEE